MRTLFSVLAIAFVGVAATSCSTQPAASVLRGNIQQATFPAPVGQITVVDAKGASTTVPVAKNGTFKASLSAGGSYHLFLSADGKSTPLVVHANLDTTIVVKSGGATVDVGDVTYRPAIAARSLKAPHKPGTGGQAAMTCSGGSDDGDGETADDQGESGSDCVDGLDAQTHQACDGGPQANQNDGETADDGEQADDGETADDASAAPSEAMGVATLEVNGDIGCAADEEDDGEEADD